MTGPVFSLHELSKNLKNTVFQFFNLNKNTGFVKHYMKNCFFFFFFFWDSRFLQDHRKLFYGGRAEQKCRPPRATMVGQQGKIKKKKHWLERPKAVPRKTKFGPEYKCFKISYLTLFGITYFTTQFQSKNVTHSTNLNSLDI